MGSSYYKYKLETRNTVELSLDQAKPKYSYSYKLSPHSNSDSDVDQVEEFNKSDYKRYELRVTSRKSSRRDWTKEERKKVKEEKELCM